MKSFFHFAKTHQKIFQTQGKKVTYKKGYCLVRPEDESPWIYFLDSGVVKVSFAFSTGEERLVGYFVPGQTFAQSGSFYSDEGGGLEYVAVEETVVYRVSRQDFFRLLRTNPDFNADYLQNLLKNQIFLIDRIVYQGESTLDRKMLKWLLFMAKYYCDHTESGCRIYVPLTHDEIANFLHVTRESAGKTLNKLAKTNLITLDRKHIIIPDMSKITVTLQDI